MAAGVLAELVQTDSEGAVIMKYFCNSVKVKLLQDLLNPSKRVCLSDV
jgi:hypothetical protein